MTPELQKYTDAVAKRKAITRKISGQSVNYAIVSQLEENDIPLLLEVIRLQDKALEGIIGLEGLDSDGNPRVPEDDEAYRCALRCRIKVSELAASGSSAKWGEYEPGTT